MAETPAQERLGTVLQPVATGKELMSETSFRRITLFFMTVMIPFLAGPTGGYYKALGGCDLAQETAKRWRTYMDTKKVSTITPHEAGYIDKTT